MQVQRPQVSCSPQQWLAETTMKKLPEARASPSLVVAATTVAGCDNNDQENRGPTSAFICRDHQQSGWQSTRRPSEQKPDERPLLLFPPPQRLAEPTLIKRTKATAPHSTVVTDTIVAGRSHADQAKRGQRSALKFRPRKHSRWLRQSKTSEQKPEQRHQLSWPQPKWLVEPTPTKRTEAR